MNLFFISHIIIKKVRHLQDIGIHISEGSKKHLILTGKNGSGKTSLLNSLPIFEWDSIKFAKNSAFYINKNCMICLNIANPSNEWMDKYNENKIIKLFYPSTRFLKVNKSEGQKDSITLNVEDFEKFLAKKRTEQAFLSFETGHEKEIQDISNWFDKLENSLKYLFEDESLKLISKRKEDKVYFYLTSNEREEYDFNTLSSGYSAILVILFDIMQKMHTNSLNFNYNEPGLILIDEIEAHLHVSLQKKILPFLTDFFPNLQFIVSTHSPFILQSLKDAVIFDLETKKRFEDFSHYSSETILETFYEIDKFSEAMKKDMKTYEEMVKSKNGVHKEEILSMRKQFLEVPDIEVSYWIKDMDIKYREKIKALLADD